MGPSLEEYVRSVILSEAKNLLRLIATKINIAACGTGIPGQIGRICTKDGRNVTVVDSGTNGRTLRRIVSIGWIYEDFGEVKIGRNDDVLGVQGGISSKTCLEVFHYRHAGTF